MKPTCNSCAKVGCDKGHDMRPFATFSRRRTHATPCTRTCMTPVAACLLATRHHRKTHLHIAVGAELVRTFGLHQQIPARYFRSLGHCPPLLHQPCAHMSTKHTPYSKTSHCTTAVRISTDRYPQTPCVGRRERVATGTRNQQHALLGQARMHG